MTTQLGEPYKKHKLPPYTRNDGGVTKKTDATPLTDGKHIWSRFGSRAVGCFDLAGNAVWMADTGHDGQ